MVFSTYIFLSKGPQSRPWSLLQLLNAWTEIKCKYYGFSNPFLPEKFPNHHVQIIKRKILPTFKTMKLLPFGKKPHNNNNNHIIGDEKKVEKFREVGNIIGE